MSNQLQLGIGGAPVRPSNVPPSVLAEHPQLKPSPVLDTYWRFAAERQSVFFRRLRGDVIPWTEDLILQRFKFTNVYRASDRVSQYLIRHVIYSGDQTPREVFFRTILFKLFNRIETWEHIASEFGETPTSESLRFVSAALDILKGSGSIYTAAYMMPNPTQFGPDFKHRNHCSLLASLLKDDMDVRLYECRTMADAFKLLRAVPSFGDFLAYQYALDLNYGPHMNFSESEFTAAGPGARDGIRKCFHSIGTMSEADVIAAVCDAQEREFERMGIKFDSLWGRPLQWIDCENLFCEVDKYARMAHPDVAGVSGRTHIKQRFHAHRDPVPAPFYPPKWGINDRIGSGS